MGAATVGRKINCLHGLHTALDAIVCLISCSDVKVEVVVVLIQTIAFLFATKWTVHLVHSGPQKSRVVMW